MLRNYGFIVCMVVLLINGCAGQIAKHTTPALPPAWIADTRAGCNIWNSAPQPNETVTWSGACSNGKANGFGELQWYKDGIKSQSNIGELKDGSLVGFVITRGEGYSREGELQNGYIQGVGIIKYASGSSYKGELKDGLEDGFGIARSPKNAEHEYAGMYVGDWKNGRQDSLGSTIWTDTGREDHGVFRDGSYIQHDDKGDRYNEYGLMKVEQEIVSKVASKEIDMLKQCLATPQSDELVQKLSARLDDLQLIQEVIEVSFVLLNERPTPDQGMIGNYHRYLAKYPNGEFAAEAREYVATIQHIQEFARGLAENKRQQEALANAMAQWLHSQGSSNHSDEDILQRATLHIKAEMGWLLPATITRYTVKVKGDGSTGYFEKEDSSGNGFWDANYVTFYSLPAGHYNILVSGYDALEKQALTATFDYEHPASGDVFCTVNPDDYPTIRCE